MSPVDLFTVCSFVCVILCGLMVLTVQDMRSKQPDARVRSRMRDSFASQVATGKPAVKLDADLFAVTRNRYLIDRWLEPKLSRLRTVAGANGIRVVIGIMIVAELVALAMVHFMPLPGFSKPLLIVGLPLLGMTRAYHFLVERFRKRFLEGFPDVIDMIVRAVRAGVPVTHVIGSAADECADPLKSEFKLMSDSLQMGRDLGEVLEVATRRIEIADFSFFCVCLLLQRETGGQLGETLENLSGIVRTRREVRQKTKALTAEARITTKILAAIPVCVMLILYASNRSYLMILFNREEGHKLLTFSVISLVLGIGLINKLSKLDTSR
jgi:Flp pilus assembly protein TadB